MIKKSQNKGFTLVEILLTMFIIALFTALTLINYKSGGKGLEFQRSVNQMSQNIRIVEQKTLSSAKCDETGGDPEDSYGVYFEVETGTGNGKKYILYADVGTHKGEYDSNDVQVGDDIFLANDVYISEIKIDGFSMNYASINFQAPEPLIDIIGDNGSGDEIDIILAQGSTGKTLIVEANTAGLIEP